MTPEDIEQIRQIVREEIHAAMKPTAPLGICTETGSLIFTKEFADEPVADIAKWPKPVNPLEMQVSRASRL